MSQGRKAICRLNVGNQIKFRGQIHVIQKITIEEDNKLTITTEERNRYLERMRVEHTQ